METQLVLKVTYLKGKRIVLEAINQVAIVRLKVTNLPFGDNYGVKQLQTNQGTMGIAASIKKVVT